MKKKILASLLAVCMFVGMAVPAFAATDFTLVHNQENRVKKIAFDKTEYNYTDVAGIALDSLLTAYDANGNRLMFDTTGPTDMQQVVYKSENESILKVGRNTANDDVLLLERNATSAVTVRVTARTVTGEFAEVKINVPANTPKTEAGFATGYTVKDTTIYYLDDVVTVASTPATFTLPIVAGDLKVGANTIKIGMKTFTVTLTDDLAANNTAIKAMKLDLMTDSGKAVTFTTTTDLAGATAALLAGDLVFTANVAAELGTITGLNAAHDELAVTVNAKPVKNTDYVKGTKEFNEKTLTVEPVGGAFSDAQLRAFKYKVSTHTTDGFSDAVTVADAPYGNIVARIVDGKLIFKVNVANALAYENLINRKAYVHVYNELFASAQLYKSAEITIIGESAAAATTAYPAVINMNVGQNLDLRTIATVLKDKKTGYAIAPYVSQDLVEANRIAKTLADTNYVVKGIAQGTVNLTIDGTTLIKLVVGPSTGYENDKYADPSTASYVKMVVGTTSKIVIKDAGTLTPVFSSYNDKIVTVAADGTMKAIAAGTGKVKVVIGDKALYVNVAVVAAPVVVAPDKKPNTPPQTGISLF